MLQQVALYCAPVVRICDDKLVAGRLARFLEATCERGEEQVLDVGHDERDEHRALGEQTARVLVGHIPQPFGGFEDLRAGLVGDARQPVIEHKRDGGDRNAHFVRDVAQGRAMRHGSSFRRAVCAAIPTL